MSSVHFHLLTLAASLTAETVPYPFLLLFGRGPYCLAVSRPSGWMGLCWPSGPSVETGRGFLEQLEQLVAQLQSSQQP